MDSIWDALLVPEVDGEEFQANRRAMEDRFAHYEGLIANLLKRAEQLEDAERKNDLMRSLWLLRYRLLQGPVRLLIVGASSAGKSTLVNALAGSVVSPEGEWTTTCVPSWITAFVPPWLAKNEKQEMVRDEDPEDDEPICYLLKPPETRSGIKGEFRTRYHYLSRFCKAPGQEAQHDYYAVRIEHRGGFLAESGITLLDTPGVGQKDEDTRMALETTALGAELLLLTIRSNVFDPEEIAIYSEMFPGGEHDLGLCPQEEVFCLYNQQPLAPMPYNVETSFQNLTANQGLENRVDTERRLYCVDVLEERKKHEAYLYYQWAPEGIQEGEAAKQKRREKEDQYGKEDFDEQGKGYRILGHQQLAGQSPGEEMRRLLDDLKLQAYALYADPERICAPIEASLREAVEMLLKDYRSQIKEITRQTEAEISRVPAKELTSPELDTLRKKFTELTVFTDLANKRKQAYPNDVDRFMQDIKKAAGALTNTAAAQTSQLETELFDKIPLDGETVDGEFWPSVIVAPLRERFVQCLKQWQDELASQRLMDTISGWITLAQGKARLEVLFQTYNDLAKEMQQFVPEIDVPLCGMDDRARERFDRDIADSLTDKTAIMYKADEMANAVNEILERYHDRRPAGTGFIMATARVIQRNSAIVKIRDTVRSCLREIVERDLKAYSGCMETHRQGLEQGDFAEAQTTLHDLAVGLAQPRMSLIGQILKEEELARDMCLYTRLERRTASLRQQARQFEFMIDELTFLTKE